MERDIKFIYYDSYAKYICIDDEYIKLNLTKKDMKYYARRLDVEFIDLKL